MEHDETRLAHLGRDPAGHRGAVNIPPYRASTILSPDLATLRSFDPDWRDIRYGRIGTPSSHAFEEAMAALEGGERAVAFGSGVQAVTTCLLAFARSGDHILVSDSCYGPTREFCDELLAHHGIATTWFDPRIGDGIAGLIRPETRLVFLESPGSLTFELHDTPAIVAVAKARGIVTIQDNTWGAGLFHKPLALGVDVSLQAATKYIVGHADASLGIAVASGDAFRAIKRTAILLGACAGSEELYLGLRGLRTLSVRMARQQETGLALAEWLAGQPEVVRVLHPARPDHPDHGLWRRDFTGAAGLFAVELAPLPDRALAALLDGLSLFGLGYSWGGFESLILPVRPTRVRTAVPWTGGQLLRLSAGLEDVRDLIADLDQGFARLRKANTP